MAWTIARPSPEITGTVLLSENEGSLGSFHELVFTDVDPPNPGGFGDLRKRLPGTRGHFGVYGVIPTSLMTAHNENKTLTLQFASHGAAFNMDVTRHGDALKMRLPDEKTNAKILPFVVRLASYVQATAPIS